MLGLFFQFKDYFNRFLAKIGPSKQRKHRNPMTCKDLLPIKQWPRKLGPAILPIDHWSRQLDQPCSPLEHRSRKSGHGFSYTTLEHWQDIQRLWNSLHLPTILFVGSINKTVCQCYLYFFLYRSHDAESTNRSYIFLICGVSLSSGFLYLVTNTL